MLKDYEIDKPILETDRLIIRTVNYARRIIPMKRLFALILSLSLMLSLSVLPAACAEGPAPSVAVKEYPVLEIMDGEFDVEKLIQIAIDNQKNSYAPYSNYNVSAAVLMDSGIVYTGANVENASYPAGGCAETNAIRYAVNCGERKIVAIAIVGGPNYEVHDYCPPCGVCRQIMREFCNPASMRVIFAISPVDYKEMTLEELLPASFGPDALGE